MATSPQKPLAENVEPFSASFKRSSKNLFSLDDLLSDGQVSSQQRLADTRLGRQA